MPDFVVTHEEAGLTIEAWLQKRIPAAPAGYLNQLLKKGKVSNRRGKLTHDALVSAGETIVLPDSQRLQELIQGGAGDCSAVEILFESREILIVNKPAGLAIHSSKGHEGDNLTDRIKALLVSRGEQFQVAPAQRLDLETSGPVIFGKGKKGCAELGKLLMEGKVKKTYLALVSGKLSGSGHLVSDIPSKGKEKTAETLYHCLGSAPKASLLEIDLLTGRQHQIRRQLADAGHPLLGDKRYHGPCPKELPRLFLHCRRLLFRNPFSGEQIDVQTQLPDELTAYLASLKLKL